jgi:hypothetical protein
MHSIVWNYQVIQYARAAQDSCTRALHCASVRTGLTNLHPPTYRRRQIFYLSHSESVPLPLHNSSGPSLISYMPGRAVASFARVQAELHTSSHTVRCPRLVYLCDYAHMTSDLFSGVQYTCLMPCKSECIICTLFSFLNKEQPLNWRLSRT